MSRYQADPVLKAGDLRAAVAGIPTGGPTRNPAGDETILTFTRLGDDERLWARRAVARHVMQRRGCLGPACTSQHAQHRAWRDTVLAALGLARSSRGTTRRTAPGVTGEPGSATGGAA